VLIEISKKPASFLDVSDPTWVDSKHARQNRVGCDGIIREQNDMQILGAPIKRPIPFHGDDAVCNDEVRAYSGADIENALVDTCPVKDIFGPAIAASGDNAKHVFHAERDAGPVVGFYLRHGDDEI